MYYVPNICLGTSETDCKLFVAVIEFCKRVNDTSNAGFS